jgi:TolB-like protein
MRIKFILLMLLMASFLGCSSTSKKAEIVNLPLIDASYKAAESLMKQAAKHRLDASKPILVASFVSIDHVQHSSTLGRLVAEQIKSRVAQLGYKVIEIKLRDSVFVQEGSGELLLSREILEISQIHNAHAVIVGTYGTIPEARQTFVNTQLIQAQDNVILAAHDFTLPMVRMRQMR